MATTWKEVRSELKISNEDEAIIELEKELIRTMVKIREEQGLSQAQLAEKCNMKQSVIARMETAVHSPQVDSLLKILTPLGYTLKIEPLVKE
jgi:transcriptional regulator with XRE-family HTH domain